MWTQQAGLFRPEARREGEGRRSDMTRRQGPERIDECDPTYRLECEMSMYIQCTYQIASSGSSHLRLAAGAGSCGLLCEGNNTVR
jgi:hypothetical protein